MLEQFRAEKLKEIAELAVREARGELVPGDFDRISFSAAISTPGLAVIAEYKRSSPSKGLICDKLSAEEVGRQYKLAGARAMSVLTETRWFSGDLAFLEQASRVGLPLLRKDFIFDRRQIIATSETPASAFLLIVRMISDENDIRSLREYGESLGLETVVEVFDDKDVAKARKSGAKIIQVNARDLNRLEVNLDSCLRLMEKSGKQDGEIWICASGISKREDLRQIESAGFDAALIGTALMRNGTPGIDLARLLKD